MAFTTRPALIVVASIKFKTTSIDVMMTVVWFSNSLKYKRIDVQSYPIHLYLAGNNSPKFLSHFCYKIVETLLSISDFSIHYCHRHRHRCISDFKQNTIFCLLLPASYELLILQTLRFHYFFQHLSNHSYFICPILCKGWLCLWFCLKNQKHILPSDY